MAETPRPLVAGNWKMNGLRGSAAELDQDHAAGRGEVAARVDLMVCPPATLLATFASLAQGTPVAIGAQDCHAEPSGAFTGDLSAEMLNDAGAIAVIVGHSERRIYHRETDAEVRAKALAAWRAGLMAIVCVGETRAERVDGQDARRRACADADVAAGRRDRRQSGRRLRAGLGDRHRADADACRRRGGAWLHPAASRDALRRGGQANPHSVWRLGEAVERRRADAASPMSTARWSAAPASRPTISSALRGRISNPPGSPSRTRR